MDEGGGGGGGGGGGAPAGDAWVVSWGLSRHANGARNVAAAAAGASGARRGRGGWCSGPGHCLTLPLLPLLLERERERERVKPDRKPFLKWIQWLDGRGSLDF
jgi:hypothetical protein